MVRRCGPDCQVAAVARDDCCSSVQTHGDMVCWRLYSSVKLFQSRGLKDYLDRRLTRSTQTYCAMMYPLAELQHDGSPIVLTHAEITLEPQKAQLRLSLQPRLQPSTLSRESKHRSIGRRKHRARCTFPSCTVIARQLWCRNAVASQQVFCSSK